MDHNDYDGYNYHNEITSLTHDLHDETYPIKEKPQRKITRKPTVVQINTDSLTDRIIEEYNKNHPSTLTVVPTSFTPTKQPSSANPDTDPDMFNESDVANLNTKNYTKIATQIAEKIKVGYNPPIYECKPETYTNIYALSDIHADYKTLLTKLYNLGIIGNINLPSNDKDDSSIRKFFIQGLSATWKNPNSLLIICGDIIDGHRKEDVTDPDGTCEILLHMFLRNLKLKAQKQGSDVILLLGNHDQDLFNNTRLDGGVTYYNHYSHEKSKEYFGSHTNKLTVLRDFYKNFTYFFGVLKNDTTGNNINKYDLIFVHAGIHSDSIANDIGNHNSVFYFLNSIQTELTKKQKDVTNEIDTVLKYKADVATNLNGALWTRAYSENYGFYEHQNPKICKIFKELPTIIVGHCINSHHKYTQNHDESRPCTGKSHYWQDDSKIMRKGNGNCIYPKCFHGSHPKIINIDTIMSEAYGGQDPNSEILFIEKKNGAYTFSSMFLKKDESVGTYDLIQAKQEGFKGGKKRKTKRKSTRRTKRKSTRKTKRKSTRKTSRKSSRRTKRKSTRRTKRK